MDWTPIIVAAITSGGAAVTAVVISHQRIVAQVEYLSKTTNSRMDELLALTRAAALAEGRLAGAKDERAAQAARDEKNNG